jgi:hypothetical protein
LFTCGYLTSISGSRGPAGTRTPLLSPILSRNLW